MSWAELSLQSISTMSKTEREKWLHGQFGKSSCFCGALNLDVGRTPQNPRNAQLGGGRDTQLPSWLTLSWCWKQRVTHVPHCKCRLHGSFSL